MRVTSALFFERPAAFESGLPGRDAPEGWSSFHAVGCEVTRDDRERDRAKSHERERLPGRPRSKRCHQTFMRRSWLSATVPAAAIHDGLPEPDVDASLPCLRHKPRGIAVTRRRCVVLRAARRANGARPRSFFDAAAWSHFFALL